MGYPHTQQTTSSQQSPKTVSPLLSSKQVTLHNKILIYKLSLKPIWSYGIQLWGSGKNFNINRIQTFQSKCLRQITKALVYVLNNILQRDLLIPTVNNVAKNLYKCFHLKLENHPKPFFPNNPRWPWPTFKALLMSWLTSRLITPITHAMKYFYWIVPSIKSIKSSLFFFFYIYNIYI